MEPTATPCAYSGAFCLTLSIAWLPQALANEPKEKISNRLTDDLILQINVQLGQREEMDNGPDGLRLNYDHLRHLYR